MIRSALNPAQRLTVEIIEALGFGRIERLWIRGVPSYLEPEPRIVQTIKLDSDPEQQPNYDPTLKKQFENLSDQLPPLRDCVVDIQTRHSFSFKLALERQVGASR